MIVLLGEGAPESDVATAASAEAGVAAAVSPRSAMVSPTESSRGAAWLGSGLGLGLGLGSGLGLGLRLGLSYLLRVGGEGARH